MTERDEEIASTLPPDLDRLPRRHGFRLRGLEMTRLEGFVDATFAFAITLLVIVGEHTPDNVDMLIRAFRNVPVFAASVAVLSIFWRGHWLWSRRYGLEDGASIAISWVIIFTMLIYVYPLKLLFGGMFYALSNGFLGNRIGVNSVLQARQLFSVYALGFSAISAEILLLNLRAWQLRRPLQLNAREQFLTVAEMRGWGFPLSIGLLCLVLALTLPDRYVTSSGWVYMLLILLVPLHASWRRKRSQQLG